MKDAKGNSATVAPSTDWGYIPHEHEELLRMAVDRALGALSATA